MVKLTETSPNPEYRCIDNHMVVCICYFSCFNIQVVFNSENIELLISEVFRAMNTIEKCWNTNGVTISTQKICRNSHWKNVHIHFDWNFKLNITFTFWSHVGRETFCKTTGLALVSCGCIHTASSPFFACVFKISTEIESNKRKPL